MSTRMFSSLGRRRLFSAAAPLDYTNEGAWFAKQAAGDKGCDVFYIHPTTVLGMFQTNVDPVLGRTTIHDGMSNDPDLLENHCGAFDEACNVWAPMYAQVGMVSLISTNMDRATPAYEAKCAAPLHRAYDDVRRAFKFFLAERPDHGRPFILAGHSQGAVLLSKVLTDVVHGSPSSDCFVAAYLAGGYVPLDLFAQDEPLPADGAAAAEEAPVAAAGVHNCTGPEDVRCVISYDTRITGMFVPQEMQAIAFGYGMWPHYLHWLLHDRYCERPVGMDDVSKPRLQINPMTWTSAAGGEYLGAKLPGATEPLLPPDGGSAFSASVTVTDKAVLVDDPRTWYTFPVGPATHGNLHPVDIQFWFYNIKDNVPKRVAAWQRWRQQQQGEELIS